MSSKQPGTDVTAQVTFPGPGSGGSSRSRFASADNPDAGLGWEAARTTVFALAVAPGVLTGEVKQHLAWP